MSDGGGPTAPVANDPGHSAIGGRGLSIVASLSLSWGVYTGADGMAETTVWAELPLRYSSDSAGAVTGLTETGDVDQAGSRATGPVPGLVTVATWDA